jgi:hypothetical protein
MAARDSTELVELVFTVELVVALAQACTGVVSVSVLAALELAYTVVVSAAVVVSVSVGQEQEQELASERAWTASGTVTVALALALAALPALVLQERQALGLEALLVSVAMSAAMLASVVEWAGLPAQAWVGTPVLAAAWAETRAVAVV